MAKAKTDNANTIAEGQTRRFRCTRTCYWDSTRYMSEQDAKQADTVEFTGPGEIPSTFQFDNWEEY